MAVRAIERCAYCRRDVQVTWIDVTRPGDDGAISATVAVCERCRLDGR